MVAPLCPSRISRFWEQWLRKSFAARLPTDRHSSQLRVADREWECNVEFWPKPGLRADEDPKSITTVALVAAVAACQQQVKVELWLLGSLRESWRA
jgi:hypothetical protein